MGESWLLMDASRGGSLRLGFAAAGKLPEADAVRSYQADAMPTFTDVLMRFQQDTGTSLLGVSAALAVGGAVAGDIISIARSRWIISRGGLTPMFGRPVVIVNEVAARAWATLQKVSVRERLHGTRDPAVTAVGRTALLTLKDGIGAAIINVDMHGQSSVIESEAGHMDFTPIGADEERLAQSLVRKAGEQVSWEQILIKAFASDARGTLDLTLAGRLAGRFAGNCALAFGAWQGVMLTGGHALTLGRPAARAAFAAAFGMRTDFRRQLGGASCWTIEQNEAVFAGLSAMLAIRHRSSDDLRAPPLTDRSASASGLRLHS